MVFASFIFLERFLVRPYWITLHSMAMRKFRDNERKKSQPFFLLHWLNYLNEVFILSLVSFFERLLIGLRVRESTFNDARLTQSANGYYERQRTYRILQSRENMFTDRRTFIYLMQLLFTLAPYSSLPGTRLQWFIHCLFEEFVES